jgi:hypothetical protein
MARNKGYGRTYEAKGKTNNRIAVCYHFSPSVTGHDHINLDIFLQQGLSKDLDVYITVAGEFPYEREAFPDITFIDVKNTENRDWNGYRLAAHIFKANPQYDYCFFINSGVAGPMVMDGSNWWEKFIDLFSEDVHLVGTSVGMPRRGNDLAAHIQSMFFCLDRQGLEFLYDQNFFDLKAEYSKLDMVENFEIKMSQLILKNGWNFNSVLSEFRDKDYRKVTQCFNPTAKDGDPYFPGAYFGRTIDPIEAVFFKTTRFPQMYKSKRKPATRFCIIAVDRDDWVNRDEMRRGLSTIAAQTYKNFDLIICHDGPKSKPYEDEVNFKKMGLKPKILNTDEWHKKWGHPSRDLSMRWAYKNLPECDYYLQFNIDNLLEPNCLEELAIAIMNNDKNSKVYTFDIIHEEINKLRNDPPDKVFPGNRPQAGNIDCLQLVAHKDIWKQYGFWYDNREWSDGYIYERMCAEFGFQHVPKMLGTNRKRPGVILD